MTSAGSAAALMAASLLAVVGPTDPAVARTGSVAGSSSAGTLTLDWGDADSTSLARGNYAVLDPWEAGRIPALRRANPDITILMYKDVSAVVKRAHESGVYATGVSYDEAAAHPGWLLHDSAGALLEWSDYRGLYPANVANRGYQDRWAANVKAELGSGHWDGVMMDD